MNIEKTKLFKIKNGFDSAMPIDYRIERTAEFEFECHHPTYRLFRTVYILQREGGEYYN